MLVEILWAECYAGGNLDADGDARGFALSTQDTSFNCNDTGVYMGTSGALGAKAQKMGISTNGGGVIEQPMIIDWSLEGRGKLVATENVYVNFDTTGAGTTQTWTVFIYYRIVKASLSDYLGLLQSQQNV